MVGRIMICTVCENVLICTDASLGDSYYCKIIGKQNSNIVKCSGFIEKPKVVEEVKAEEAPVKESKLKLKRLKNGNRN